LSLRKVSMDCVDGFKLMCFEGVNSMGKQNSRPVTMRDQDRSVPITGAEFHA
jgi:hypothetical protein